MRLLVRGSRRDRITSAPDLWLRVPSAAQNVTVIQTCTQCGAYQWRRSSRLLLLRRAILVKTTPREPSLEVCPLPRKAISRLLLLGAVKWRIAWMLTARAGGIFAPILHSLNFPSIRRPESFAAARYASESRREVAGALPRAGSRDPVLAFSARLPRSHGDRCGPVPAEFEAGLNPRPRG